MRSFSPINGRAIYWCSFARPRISIPNLRDQAMRAATSACLNIAEATGRAGADQKRVFLIARGEAAEAAAALDVAVAAGACAPETACAGREKALDAYALLTGLIRR